MREKEAPDAGMSMAQAAGVSIDPWDLPWALELANGDQCTLLGGTLSVMAGQTVHYGCADGGTILGEVQHRDSRLDGQLPGRGRGRLQPRGGGHGLVVGLSVTMNRFRRVSRKGKRDG